jgi:toxin FitB
LFTWVAQQPGTELFTTSITEAEFFYGIELLGRGKRREGLLAGAEGMFSEDFAGRVFVFDSDVARVFAKIGLLAVPWAGPLAMRMRR